MKTTLLPNIDELIADRQYFDAFVYTPMDQALKALELRKENSNITQYINQILPSGIPGFFKGYKNAILGRQIATPNFELNEFCSVANKLPGFKKKLLVMHQDKFTPCNESKYHLGKIVCSSGNVLGGRTKSVMAVDFNKFSGKKISEVQTLWGQGLVDFHNELLQRSLPKELTSEISQFEGSDWIARLGKTAKEFYSKILLLFLQNGILFENFLLKEKGETRFTKEVFLPAFIKIMTETGHKPLIVPFLPTESEESNFWNHYPYEYYEFVRSKRALTENILDIAAA